jgi:hypothetical protein
VCVVQSDCLPTHACMQQGMRRADEAMIDVQSDRKPAHPRRRQQMPRPPARAFIRSRPASVARGRSSEHMSRTHGRKRNQCDSISTCPVSSSQAQDAPTLFSGRGESKELLITQMRHRKPKSSVRACLGLGSASDPPSRRCEACLLRSAPVSFRSFRGYYTFFSFLFFLSGTWLTTPGTGNPKPAALCHVTIYARSGPGAQTNWFHWAGPAGRVPRRITVPQVPLDVGSWPRRLPSHAARLCSRAPANFYAGDGCLCCLLPAPLRGSVLDWRLLRAKALLASVAKF